MAKNVHFRGRLMTDDEAVAAFAELQRVAGECGVAIENSLQVAGGGTSARLIAIPRPYAVSLFDDTYLDRVRREAARMRGHALMKIAANEHGPFDVEPIDETQLQLLEGAGLRILELVDTIRRNRDAGAREVAEFAHNLHKDKLTR